jgi:hypothetical protein
LILFAVSEIVTTGIMLLPAKNDEIKYKTNRMIGNSKNRVNLKFRSTINAASKDIAATIYPLVRPSLIMGI